MKKLAVIAAIALGTVLTAQADLIAYFNMGTATPIANPLSPFEQALGVNASLSFGVTNATADGIAGTSYTDPEVNGGSSVAAGRAISWTSGANDGENDWTVSLDLSGWMDVEFRFDHRTTSTGPTAADLAYNIGEGWVSLGSFAFANDSTFASSGWQALPSAVNGQSSVMVRMNNFTDGTGSGTAAIDNLHISGTVIPEPGTLALFGVASGVLLALRRRIR